MEGMIGEIRLFAGNFAPRAWAFCEGQLLPINQNQALFSILGTIYGGDGRTTFALPDLRGRVALGPGHGPGLSDYRLGARGGVENVTLNATQIPSHNHTATPQLQFAQPASTAPANTPSPGPAANPGTTQMPAYSNGPATTTLAAGDVTGDVQIGNTGGGLSHENRQPFLAVNYIICLQGVFPSRS